MDASSNSGRDLVPVNQKRYERDKERVEKGFWPKVKRVMDQVPFIEEAVAAYYCTRDPATPLQVKAVLFGALAYFIVPTDLLPDVVAAFGYTDVATVLALAVNAVAPHVKDQHRESARRFRQDNGAETAPDEVGPGETA